MLSLEAEGSALFFSGSFSAVSNNYSKIYSFVTMATSTVPLFKKMLSTIGTCSESISGSFYLYLFATEDEKSKKKTWKVVTCFVLFISLLSFFPHFSSFFFCHWVKKKKNLSFHKFISQFAFLLKIVLKYIFWFCMPNKKGGKLRNDYLWGGKGGGGLTKQGERGRF